MDLTDRDILQMAIAIYPSVITLNYPRDVAVRHSIELAEQFAATLTAKRAQEAADAAAHATAGAKK